MEDNQNTNGPETGSMSETPVSSDAHKEEDRDDHHKTLMGVLAYLGPLVLIPFLVAREDSFVKFHIKQGVVLFIISLLVWAASVIMWFLMPLWAIVNFAVLILALIGVLNVVRGKEKEIPLVGHYSAKIHI